MTRFIVLPLAFVALCVLAQRPCSAAGTLPPPPPFFNAGGVALYQPVVGVILSGEVLWGTAVVSHDRKYVTLGMQPRSQRLINLRTFPVMTVANAGPIGNVAPAPVIPGALAADVNMSLPVDIRPGQGGAILKQVGMTRITPDY